MSEVEIITGDCIETMRQMPAASIDAVITDPPYGQTSLSWDRWLDGWAQECARILKPTGSIWVFGTLRMFTANWSEFEDWKFAEDIVWEKHNGSSFHNDRFRRVHEQAVHFYRGAWSEVWKGRVVTNDTRKRVVRRKERPPHMGAIEGSTYTSEDGGPRLMRSVIYARSEHGRAIHPTQKPVEIIEPLMLNSCPPGGTVFDPFGGSGTTGIAAINTGRNAIICELSAEYADMARTRVAAHREALRKAAEEAARQPDLFRGVAAE